MHMHEGLYLYFQYQLSYQFTVFSVQFLTNKFHKQQYNISILFSVNCKHMTILV